MKAARAAGIIERFPFPTGAELRRMKPQSQLPFDAPRLLKRADRAYRLIIDRCEKGDSELAEMLDTAARTGLKRLHEIVLLPTTRPGPNPEDPPIVDATRLAAVQNAARAIVAFAARVQPDAFRSRARSRKIDLLLRLRGL